jgi:hypothetical protein
MRRDTCPDLFDERQHFDELVSFDQIQLRLAELKHQGAVVYSMDVKRGAYVVRGSLNVRHRLQPAGPEGPPCV